MKRPPRIDRDALPRQWPVLYAGTPGDREFIRRDASVEIDLPADAARALQEFSTLSGISVAGLLLRILFTHVYGRYTLAKMQREHTGLFAGGNGEDPSRHSGLTVQPSLAVQLGVPQRLHDDLDVLAEKQSISSALLTRAIVRAHLLGHPDAHAKASRTLDQE